MLLEDTAREATVATSTTINAGFVTISIPAVAGKRSIIFGIEYTTDTSPTVAAPLEFRGGGAGTTVKWAISNGASNNREYPQGMVLSDVGVASDVRVPCSVACRLNVRYGYV